MLNIKNSILFLCFTFLIDSLHSQDSLFYFQAKSHIQTIRGAEEENFTAHIRYNLKDTLWISITGPLGIEGARMLFTSDSTYVYNKMEKSFHQFSNTTENAFIPYQFTMNDWKLVLLNIPPVLDSHSNIIVYNDTIIATHYIDNQRLTVFNFENKVIRCAYKNRVSQTNCTIHFNDFVNSDSNFSMARNRSFIIDNMESVQINVRYVDYKFNKPMEFPFNFAKYRNASN